MTDKYNIEKDIKMIDDAIENANPSTNDDHLVLAKLLQTKATLISVMMSVNALDELDEIRKKENDI